MTEIGYPGSRTGVYVKGSGCVSHDRARGKKPHPGENYLFYLVLLLCRATLDPISV